MSVSQSSLISGMDSSEKLCLQWNDFKENITFFFKELRNDKDFTDVTLACEDGQHIAAHKTVLASSSPFFMELLKKHKHPHPLIYMRGIKSSDLVTIMDFLYYGEVNVLQDNLNTFLELAEELNLKGLSGSSQTDQDPHQSEPQKRVGAPVKKEHGENPIDSFDAPVSKKRFDPQYSEKSTCEKTVALTNTGLSVELQDLDDQIKSMITKTNISAGLGKGFLATCNVCGQQKPFMQMPQHIEANHITGISHSCDLCGKTSRSRNALKVHKIAYHK